MAQGRGSAAMGAVMVCLLVLQFSAMAHAAVYTVGGAQGWTFNVASWPKGKRFRAGDTLVFNYSPAAHNVVAVSRVGYSGCVAPTGSKVFGTGTDQIKLVKGQNYFICSLPGHCQSGMKIAINAA
ncbi:basic blue protein-like [Cucurbita moschata]|uniref:Basic blue protein n=1 Tax=Cucurbita moschata TaxID=3662 RepID=A0A6J1FRV0_CUCMO|nr:basic blue protein-like [Cucurbita moschata]